jgi:putative addiction module component (TIGR02574 family)
MGAPAPSSRRRLAIVALSWHLEAMSTDLGFDYRRLSVAQRLELVEDNWDSIDADADAEMLPLTDDERAMLDERVAELDANPGQGRSWPEVRARILGRTRR